MEWDKTLARLEKKTAENIAVEQFTVMYNSVKENELDMSKLELVLRNTFAAGAMWQAAVLNDHFKTLRTYSQGLDDMFDAADNVFDNDDDWDEFYNKLTTERSKLKYNH